MNAVGGVSICSHVTSRLTVHAGVTSRLTVHTGVTSRLTVHAGVTSRLIVHTGVTSRLTVHTGVTSRLTVHTGVTSRLTVHTDVTSRLTVHTGVTSRLTVQTGLGYANMSFSSLRSRTSAVVPCCREHEGLAATHTELLGRTAAHPDGGAADAARRHAPHAAPDDVGGRHAADGRHADGPDGGADGPDEAGRTADGSVSPTSALAARCGERSIVS